MRAFRVAVLLVPLAISVLIAGGASAQGISPGSGVVQAGPAGPPPPPPPPPRPNPPPPPGP
jgi:hypothetical protein